MRRTQIFVNGLFAQCLKYRLPAELIIVEWNPPPDKIGLHEAICWNMRNDYCAVRVIRVPPDVHSRFAHSSKMPLFQMIAKNVGIRRARGKFVLATNIDVLFSEELMAYLGQQTLDPERMYRVDRHDVLNEVPLHASIEEQLAFCRQNRIRINRRGETIPLTTDECFKILDEMELGLEESRINFNLETHEIGECNCRLQVRITDPQTPPEDLHTNACGDFTLMSKDKWAMMRGYPEFTAYSFHIDTLLCYMAHYAGVLETYLPPPCVTFHIEHALGSGWSPEGSQALFKRLDDAEIPYIDYMITWDWGKAMHAGQEPIIFNNDGWGLSWFSLEEVGTDGSGSPRPCLAVCAPCEGEHGKSDILQGCRAGEEYFHFGKGGKSNLDYCALCEEFELDKVQIAHLKRDNERLKAELKDAIALYEQRGHWIEELENARAWNEQQWRNYKAELEKILEAWQESRKWIEELEEAKAWLLTECRRRQSEAQSALELLREAEKKIQKLEGMN